MHLFFGKFCEFASWSIRLGFLYISIDFLINYVDDFTHTPHIYYMIGFYFDI